MDLFKKDADFTESEKIDYVFKKLRKQARMAGFLLGFKVFLVWLVVYAYINILPSLNVENLMQTYVVPQISKIVSMTVQSTMKDVSSSLMWWAAWGMNIDPSLANELAGQVEVPAMNSAPAVSSAPSWAATWTVIQNRRKNTPKINITPEMIEAVKKSMNQQ